MPKRTLGLVSVFILMLNSGCGLTLDIASLDQQLDLGLCVGAQESSNLSCKTISINQVKNFRLAEDNTCSFINVNPVTGEISGIPSVRDSGTCLLSVEADREREVFKGKKELTITSKAPFQKGGVINGSLLSSYLFGSMMILSPDQLKLAFLIGNSDLSYSLMAVRVDGTQFVKLNLPDTSVSKFAFSPLSDRIYFTLYSGELYSVNLDGTNLFRLSQAGERTTYFSVTSSGEFVVYHESVSGQIYKIKPDGSSKQPLLQQPRSASGPFNLDVVQDTHVVFLSNKTFGVLELFSVPLDGSGEVMVHPPLASGGSIKAYLVSKNKQRVVFRGDVETDEKYELYSVKFDGSGLVKLNSPLAATGDVKEEFIISSNSSKVAYVANQSTTSNYDLYSVDIDGTNNTKLTAALGANKNVLSGLFHNCYVAPGKNCYVRFTPDSNKVLYIANQDTDNLWELYSVSTDGTGNQKISGSSTAGTFVSKFWIGPDSSKVFFMGDMAVDNQYGIYSVNLSNLLRTRLDSGTGNFSFYDNSPLSVSPNSQFVMAPFSESSGSGYETIAYDSNSGTKKVVLGGEGISNQIWIGSPDNSSVFSIFEKNGGLEVVKVDFSTLTPQTVVRVPIDLMKDKFTNLFDDDYRDVAADENFEHVGFVTTSTTSMLKTLWHFDINTSNVTSVFTSSLASVLYLQKYIDAAQRFSFYDGFRLKTVKPDGSGLNTLNQVSGGYGVRYIETLKSGKVILTNEELLYATELYTVDADGTNSTRINAPTVTSSNYVRYFRVTPDESKLVYLTSESGVNQIMTSSLDGATKMTLTTTEAFFAADRGKFLVSPDSSKIAWSVYSGSGPFIYVAPLNGSSPPAKVGNLQMVGGLDPDFKWSPQSDKLIVRGDFLEKSKMELFVTNAGSGTYTKISPNLISAGNVSDYVLSSDGNWVYIVADAEVDNKFEIFAYNLQSASLSKLTTNLSLSSQDLESYLQLSPENDFLVFLAKESEIGPNELYSLRLGSQVLSKLNSDLPLRGYVNKKFYIGVGCRVIYSSNELNLDVNSLFSVSCNGSGRQKIDSYTERGAGVVYYEFNSKLNNGFYIGRSNNFTQNEIRRFSW